jgi:hypothetical protein
MPPARPRRVGRLCPTTAATVHTSGRPRTRGAPPCPTPRSDGPYVPTAPRRVGRLCPAGSDDPCLQPAADARGPLARPLQRWSVRPARPGRVGPFARPPQRRSCLRPVADARVPFARPPPRRSVSPAGRRRAGPLCPTAATTVRTSSRPQTRGAHLPDHRSDVHVSGRRQMRAAAVVCGRCCQSAGGAGSWHAGGVDVT